MPGVLPKSHQGTGVGAPGYNRGRALALEACHRILVTSVLLHQLKGLLPGELRRAATLGNCQVRGEAKGERVS